MSDEWSLFRWAMVQVLTFLVLAWVITELTPIEFEELFTGYLLVMLTWIFYRVGHDE